MYRIYWRENGVSPSNYDVNPERYVNGNAGTVIGRWYTPTSIRSRGRVRLDNFVDYLRSNHPNQKLDNLEFIWNLWKLQHSIS